MNASTIAKPPADPLDTWQRLMAAYDAAREAADAALGESDAANSAEFHAWEALMRTDAPDLAAVQWKLDELFGDVGRERIEGGFVDGWLLGFTDVILADVERLIGGAA
ncbi:MAG: hypothetical protein WA978_00990 [Sphingopyxis granuli]|uniref:hypothetical protein n=1 Tax=Sphingopyxis granuli TaxID=267128 RepID=UPI003C718E66